MGRRFDMPFKEPPTVERNLHASRPLMSTTCMYKRRMLGDQTSFNDKLWQHGQFRNAFHHESALPSYSASIIGYISPPQNVEYGKRQSDRVMERIVWCYSMGGMVVGPLVDGLFTLQYRRDTGVVMTGARLAAKDTKNHRGDSGGFCPVIRACAG